MTAGRELVPLVPNSWWVSRSSSPDRSAGGQRRYSRAELTLAIRVRGLLDENMPLIAAIRIISLERQLEAAHRRIAYLESTVLRGPG